MTEIPILGTVSAGDPMPLDVDRLIGSHACIVANSGGGKSGLIRRMLEVTHGRIQHIVLDVEDEFYTLREHFDYVIAGGDGADAPATVDNAAALARMTLEQGFSLIVQLNDLGPDGAPQFVGRFLEALIAAPRALWRPLLVILDEAQRFAPQEGATEATHGVRALAAQGRKRGFTAILASQRIAKIDADVRGDINNWMLGRVGQSLDRRTMADALGFPPSGAEARGLQGLPDRTFWGFGPALSREPTLFRVSDVETTPVRPGQAKVPTPPPPEALRAILQGLAVVEVPADQQAPASGSSPSNDAAKRDTAELSDLRGRLARAETDKARLVDELEACVVAMDRLTAVSTELKRRHDAARTALDTADLEIPAPRGGTPAPPPRREPATPPKVAPRPEGGVASGKGEVATELNSIGHSILDNLKRIAPASLTWTQAAQMADRSPKSGPYFAAKKQLMALGLVEVEGQHVRAPGSGDGITRAEAIDLWRLTLEGFAPRMLAALADERPRTRQELGDELGLSIKSGPWFRGLKDLRERGLMTDNSGYLSLVTPVPGERPTEPNP